MSLPPTARAALLLFSAASCAEFGPPVAPAVACLRACVCRAGHGRQACDSTQLTPPKQPLRLRRPDKQAAQAVEPSRGAASTPDVGFHDLVRAVLGRADLAFTVATDAEGPRVDVLKHHGEAYSSWEIARIEGRVRDGAVLVHLDAHADMADMVGLVPRPRTPREALAVRYDIASFIVPAAAVGLVREVWLVQPDYQEKWPEHFGTREYAVGVFADAHGVRAAALVPSDAEDVERATLERARFDYECARMGGDLEFVSVAGRLTVHDVHLEELPDFRGEGRSVILDVDEDYFLCLSGATEEEWEELQGPVSDDDLGTAVRRTFDVLRARGLRSGAVTVALSPVYTPRRWMQRITELVVENLERAGLARFERDPDGRALVSAVMRPQTEPEELLAARAALEGGRLEEALRLADSVLHLCGPEAGRQEEAGRGLSLFANGRSELTQQPSPVAFLEQRELNACAGARLVTSRAFRLMGETGAAAEEARLVLVEYGAAYLPLSACGGVVPTPGGESEGWWKASSVAREHLLRCRAELLLAGGRHRRAEIYLSLPEDERPFLVPALEAIRERGGDAMPLLLEKLGGSGTKLERPGRWLFDVSRRLGSPHPSGTR
jgi:hypothetical protein